MKKAALCIGAAVVVAASIFTSLRVISLSERIATLEQLHVAPHPSEAAAAPVGYLGQPAPRIEPPDGSSHAIESVVDGDTAKIRYQGEAIGMRIVGIDTPETVHPSRPVEPFGPEASKRAAELLVGKTVRIHYDPDPKHDTWGKYGRLLVYLDLPDGRDFGLVMIGEGMARAYPKYPFSRSETYLAAEKKAREAKVGMWKDTPTSEAVRLSSPREDRAGQLTPTLP